MDDAQPAALLPGGSAPLAVPARRSSFFARPRFWVGLGVTVLWLSVMTLMWLRESGRMGGSLRQMGVSPEVLLVSWNDYEQWLWIEQNGQRLGASQMALTLKPQRAPATAAKTRELPGYLEEARTHLAWRLLGFEVPLEIATRVDLNPAFEMDALQAVVHVAGRQLLLQAFTEGGQLYYRCRVGLADGNGLADGSGAADGHTPAANVDALPAGGGGMAALFAPRDVCGQTPLTEPIFMSDTIIPILTRSETLKAGQRWTTRASNLLEGVMRDEVRVTVDAEEEMLIGEEKVKVWRLTESFGALRSTVWYDQRGRVVRRDLGEGSAAALSRGIRFAAAGRADAIRAYPVLDKPYAFPSLDRAWIRQHVSPELRGKPLRELLPQLPSL